MKALVTGAGGFIGSFILKELVSRGYEARALFLPHEDSTGAEKSGVEIVRGDLTRPDTLRNIADDIDLVFHLAGRVLDWGPKKAFKAVMVDGTKSLLEECKGKIKRFIYFSSIAALGMNRNLVGLDEDAERQRTGISYCDTKIDAEILVNDFCIQHDMSYVIIRPSNVIGPGSVWVKDIIDAFQKGPMPLIGDGNVPGAFIYINNLVDGTIYAAELENASGRTYHLRDDYDITWKQYMETLGSWVDKKPFVSVPVKLAWALASFFEVILNPISIRPPISRLAVGVLGRNNDVDNSRARKELNWKSRINLNEAMDEIRQWVIEEYLNTQK
ncbi:MAG: NAD-dependent epimerase/dehydratase family protein [Desulfobacterales bacterium]|jgi:2-alkyl-3-oxoalkanoate reductase|nr:NAD-dependent epimerase/dehydratase family protein [Desulfobacteraceae bacterium]MBT4363083.1 NAD-dependent epimerase/dehydratase family protein [Desulfobacteraceae bacterium]MBT7084706.1 NAD-dependent epimerase/dehydratase family protein [Desulfobacterales bacterium]MBT7697468.1 NAD-dependent epimerase/dehydratase family protein [Desulfobacterales bacterium]